MTATLHVNGTLYTYEPGKGGTSMTGFADELRGSEGEWCGVRGLPLIGMSMPPMRRAIIRAVHDGGNKVTVQFEDDNTTMVATYHEVELEGEEA